jgi:hypothetical protein
MTRIKASGNDKPEFAMIGVIRGNDFWTFYERA